MQVEEIITDKTDEEKHIVKLLDAQTAIIEKLTERLANEQLAHCATKGRIENMKKNLFQMTIHLSEIGGLMQNMCSLLATK